MILNLTDLYNKTLKISRAVFMSDARFPLEGVRYTEPVVVDLVLEGRGRDYKLSGSLSTTLLLTCHRCLTSFKLPVEQQVDLLFIPRDEMPDEIDVELAGQDMNIASYIDAIDLCDIINEQMALAMPMQLLCKLDCMGLCQHCGKNLNAAGCGCEKSSPDPRLAALKDIRDRIANSEKNRNHVN